MSKYGKIAISAYNYVTQKNETPLTAWEKASNNDPKPCPKNTFLGLCNSGLLKNIPKGKYAHSSAKENLLYGPKGVELIKKEPNLRNSPDDLWIKILEELNLPTDKTKNSQPEVIIALWDNDFIEKQ